MRSLKMKHHVTQYLMIIGGLLLVGTSLLGKTAASDYRIATFSADVTIPLNHRCMGILPTKSAKIVDRLGAHGFVLIGDSAPIVFCAIDWCEIRNGAYDQWRDALAQAAGTTRERVLISSLHQHDAPVTDSGAARLLAEVRLANELYDVEFHTETISRVASIVSESMKESQPIDQIGMGEAEVLNIASNRRVVMPDGSVSFGRGSRSRGDAWMSEAPDGLIDPKLKSLSFWYQDRPLAVLHAYATHPMSYYGAGEVTSDFVGLAREQRQREDFSVKQIYASGCSGDVTAGKYNDGSHQSRRDMTERLHGAMVAAWEATRREPLQQIVFRNAQVELPFSQNPELSQERLTSLLLDPTQTTEQRIWAAMGLASRERLKHQPTLDLPCVDLGVAKLLLLPGESFVGHQLQAQALIPDSFVVTVGYGECWPGYIPTESAFDDGFEDNWLWVDRGSEERLRDAMRQVLGH